MTSRVCYRAHCVCTVLATAGRAAGTTFGYYREATQIADAFGDVVRLDSVI